MCVRLSTYVWQCDDDVGVSLSFVNHVLWKRQQTRLGRVKRRLTPRISAGRRRFGRKRSFRVTFLVRFHLIRRRICRDINHFRKRQIYLRNKKKTKQQIYIFYKFCLQANKFAWRNSHRVARPCAEHIKSVKICAAVTFLRLCRSVAIRDEKSIARLSRWKSSSKGHVLYCARNHGNSNRSISIRYRSGDCASATRLWILQRRSRDPESLQVSTHFWYLKNLYLLLFLGFYRIKTIGKKFELSTSESECIKNTRELGN